MSTGVSVVAGQQNRVPESTNPYFVVMTPIRFQRLATNVDSAADVKFVGSISGSTLTVASVDTGTIQIGAPIFGTGVSSGTQIVQQLSGTPGGIGTYQIAPSQTVAEETLSGQNVLTQDARIVIQLDCHSPDTSAGDFAQTISTALRDEYAQSYAARTINGNPIAVYRLE